MTASLLSQGESRCNIDTEAALRRSRIPLPPSPSSAIVPSPKRDANETGTDVQCVYEASPPVSGIRGAAYPSGPAEAPAAVPGTGSPQDVFRLRQEDERVLSPDHDNQTRGDGGHDGGHEETADGIKGGDDTNRRNRIVDRGRLIAVIAAEAQINAMANHLGSAATTTNLRSLLLAKRSSGGPPPSSVSRGFSKGAQQASQLLSSPPMFRQSISADRSGKISATPTKRAPTVATAGEFPCLKSGDSSGHTRQHGGGPAPAREQHRSQSADDLLLPSTDQAESWNGPDAVGAAVLGEMPGGGGSGADQRYNYGRKKRSRGGEEAGQSGEEGERILEDNKLGRLSGSNSFAMGRRHHMTAPVASTMERSSYCSLPKLNASRLSW